MSDIWYREPLSLPPWEDGFGQAWNFDGTPANQAAQMSLTPPPSFIDEWPEDLQWIAFQASVNMELLDMYHAALDGSGTGQPRGILGGIEP